jgi:hypothetical protein
MLGIRAISSVVDKHYVEIHTDDLLQLPLHMELTLTDGPLDKILFSNNYIP